MFDFAKFQRIAVAAIGAVIFTTVSVGAAVGPAEVAEATPVAAGVAAQDADRFHA
jgi:hypothetical protein